MDVDVLYAKINELEGRLAALEGRGDDSDTHGYDSPTGGNGASATHDPKGRKIWEAEWDGEDHSMKAFIPKGAVVVGNTPLDVDATGTREGDEVKLTAGTWYLHVHKDSATLDNTEHEASAGDDLLTEMKIIEISEKGDYVANQFVIGAVTINKPLDFSETEAAVSDEVLKPGDNPTVEVEEVAAEGDKPKHLKFTFGIPPGEKGEDAKGDDGKSISRVELSNDSSTKRIVWKLNSYREGETTPISSFELIGYYDDSKELIIGGKDTGIIAQGEMISSVTLKEEKDGEKTYSIMAGHTRAEEHEVGTFTVKDGTTEKISGVVPRGVVGKDRTYALLGDNGRTIGTFVVRDGADGDGGDGDVDINVVNRGDHTEIYVDGDLAGSIPHGQKPNITSETIGKVTYIKCDGKIIAEIYNGADLKPSEEETLDIVTGVAFAIEGGKLVSKVTKKRIKASNIQDIGTTSVNVCDIAELDVVTSEQYSTTTHAFTNTRKKIKVFGMSDATGQTPFTAEPLSAQ